MSKIVFMGTPQFAVPSLELLQNWEKSEKSLYVYTQPDRPAGRGLNLKPSPVKQKALELGLPIFQPEKLSSREEIEKLKALKPDVIVVVAFGQILKKEVLELPPFGCVNTHASLLPRWRGAAPIVWSILSGDAESGVTTQKMAEKLDSGDILLQIKTPLTAQDTAQTLHDRLSKQAAEILIPTLEGLFSRQLRGVPQNAAEVTLAPKLTKEMGRLDLGASIEVLDRQLRALNPWPGAWVRAQGELLKIKKAVCNLSLKGHEGELFERAGMLLLGAKDGAFEIERLQWEGKKELSSAEFLNGLKGRGQSLPLKIKVES